MRLGVRERWRGPRDCLLRNRFAGPSWVDRDMPQRGIVTASLFAPRWNELRWEILPTSHRTGHSAERQPGGRLADRDRTRATPHASTNNTPRKQSNFREFESIDLVYQKRVMGRWASILDGPDRLSGRGPGLCAATVCHLLCSSERPEVPLTFFRILIGPRCSSHPGHPPIVKKLHAGKPCFLATRFQGAPHHRWPNTPSKASTDRADREGTTDAMADQRVTYDCVGGPENNWRLNQTRPHRRGILGLARDRLQRRVDDPRSDG